MQPDQRLATRSSLPTDCAAMSQHCENLYRSDSSLRTPSGVRAGAGHGSAT